MKDKKTKTVGTIVVMFAIVIAVLIGFWQILEGKRAKEKEMEFKQSNVEEVNHILNKDYENNYPSTPREVIKAYSRISSCVYNYNLKEKDLELVVEKMRQLFDEELLIANPWDEHLEDLKKDINEYQKAKRKISNYVVDKNSSSVNGKVDDRECAVIHASFLVQEGDGYTKSYEQFLLRKDENGKWKILGWELVEPQEE